MLLEPFSHLASLVQAIFWENGSLEESVDA
jgi:hypothetical protein